MHILTANIWKWRQRVKTILLSINKKYSLHFRFAHLHLTLTYSEGQGQGQGQTHFDCEISQNEAHCILSNVSNYTFAFSCNQQMN